MRKWILAVVAVLLLLAGAIALAAANLDSYIEQNRDWIAKQAESVVGRSVAFGKVGISFRGGLGVRVADLRIGDDPAFSKDPFVAADAIDIRVALLPALFGDIQVDRVILRKPLIQVIQTAGGLSTDSLAGASQPKQKGQKAQESPQPLPAFLVGLVDISDGTLRYIDKTTRPPSESTIEQLDLRALDITATGPIEFEADAAILASPHQNVHVTGSLSDLQNPKLAFRLVSDALELTPAVGGATADVLRDLQIEGSVAMAGSSPRVQAALRSPGGSLTGAAYTNLSVDFRFQELVARIEKLTASVFDGGVEASGNYDVRGAQPAFDLQTRLKGLRLEQIVAIRSPDLARELRGELAGSLDLAGRGSDWDQISGTLKGKGGLQLVDAVLADVNANLSTDFRFQDRVGKIENLHVSVFGGAVDASGSCDVRGAQPAFDLQTRLTGLRLEQILATRSPDLARKLRGELAGSLDLAGRGSDWEQISGALKGKGGLQLIDGVIADVNVAESALQAVTGAPGFSGLLPPSLRQKYPQLFGVGETAFEKMDAKVEIRDGWANFRDFRLAARDYALGGQGRISLSNQLDMTAVMTCSEPLSTDLVAAAPQMQYLENPQGRVEFPLKLTGSPPEIRPAPDLAYIARAASRRALGNLLERTLGSSGPQSATGASAQQQPATDGSTQQPAPGEAPAQPTAEDAARELLNRGLRDLFK